MIQQQEKIFIQQVFNLITFLDNLKNTYSKENFIQSKKLQYAVFYSFKIIGESLLKGNIQNTINHHPSLGSVAKDAYEMRDLAIHRYIYSDETAITSFLRDIASIFFESNIKNLKNLAKYFQTILNNHSVPKEFKNPFRFIKNSFGSLCESPLSTQQLLERLKNELQTFQALLSELPNVSEQTLLADTITNYALHNSYEIMGTLVGKLRKKENYQDISPMLKQKLQTIRTARNSIVHYKPIDISKILSLTAQASTLLEEIKNYLDLTDNNNSNAPIINNNQLTIPTNLTSQNNPSEQSIQSVIDTPTNLNNNQSSQTLISDNNNIQSSLAIKRTKIPLKATAAAFKPREPKFSDVQHKEPKNADATVNNNNEANINQPNPHGFPKRDKYLVKVLANYRDLVHRNAFLPPKNDTPDNNEEPSNSSLYSTSI